MQVYLQEAYEAYHAQELAGRVPPIPTAVVRVPGSTTEQALLCYTEAKYAATDAHVDAIMRTIYEAVLRLESSLPADSSIRYVQARQLALTSSNGQVLHFTLLVITPCLCIPARPRPSTVPNIE